MKARIVSVAAVLLVAVALRADDAAADRKAKLAKFERSWNVESLVINGNSIQADNLKNVTLRFKGSDMFLDADNNGQVATTKFPVTIDPGFDPGLFDVRIENEKRTLEGIYKFDGDRLKLCINQNGQNRPTEFTAAEGANILVVLTPKQ